MTASTDSARDSRASRLACAWLLAAALAYAAGGACAMLLLTPRVPYADQWRHYAHLLTLPFPANLFEFDNGHAEVLPNLLRLLDLRVFGGHEALQVYCAAVLALCAAGLFVRSIKDPQVRPVRRAAQALVVVLGVFWLGNLRALAQPGDGVHVYLVLACLGAALCVTVDVRERPVPKTLLASLFCVLASFSFGSGIAVFAAVLAVLLMQRAPGRVLLIPAAALLASVGVYAAMAGLNGGSTHALAAASVTSLRVLSMPCVYAAAPLLDQAAVSAIPAPLNAFAIAVADAWTARFGAIRGAAAPQALIGLIGTLWLLALALRAWRAGRATRAAYAGIGLACFGAAAGVLIALARQDYFLAHAEQIGAPRYVPWSSLFWAGSLLAQLGQERARVSSFIVALLPVLLLPSEVGLALLARHVREVAEDTALYTAVGVLPEGATLGETVLEEVRSAMPVLRAAHTAIYAWPETELLERDAQITVRTQDVRIRATPTANRLGDDGRSISDVQLLQPPCSGERALVVEQGRVVGLLRRGTHGRWHGVARATGGATTPTLAHCVGE